MQQVLIKDRKYQGQYVAIEDFNRSKVISHGRNPKEVYRKSVSKGYKSPVIIFLPPKNMVHIY